MSDDILERVSQSAFAALKEVGGDPAQLSEPFRTVVVVTSAQGIIDNGGLTHFFEADFPGSPAYGEFVDAYRRIQALEAAEAIEKAASLFPSGAQCPPAERCRILQENAEQVAAWDDVVCGNERIWELLAEYAASNTGKRPI